MDPLKVIIPICFDFSTNTKLINTNSDALSRNSNVENSSDKIEEQKQSARLLSMLTKAN